MATQASQTDLVEALYAVPGKAEIVGGEIVLMSPAGGLHGRAGATICRSLWEYEQRTKRGRAYPDNVGFLVDLPNRKSFSPDAAFYMGPPPRATFLEGTPALAVEVRSPEEYGPIAERALAAKRAEYFAAGTEVVWDVDILREAAIRVFGRSAPDDPRIYRRGEVAEAEPALPGWTFPVDELFLDED